jgi:hypothetical protein
MLIRIILGCKFINNFHQMFITFIAERYTISFMIKKFLFLLVALAIPVSAVFPQKISQSSKTITASHLETYVSFLASPLLKGRMNGDESLDLAATYIASQAKLIGLKPANGNSYLQPYSIISTTADPAKTYIKVVTGSDTVTIRKPFYNYVPTGPADIDLEGEVVFGGYGIKDAKSNYNDLGNIDPQGKILIIMDGFPTKKDGKTPAFESVQAEGEMGLIRRVFPLLSSKPKAVLLVTSPKSGFRSFAESQPGIAGFLNSRMSMKGAKDQVSPFMSMMPKIICIDMDVADAVLKGSGKTLAELQNLIDASLQPQSFLIPGKKLIVKELTLKNDKVQNNVAAFIEGSDPVLKNEVVVFSGHYDHIGAVGGKINAGADDDASGCAALLSMAEAFQSLKKKPSRSILFLWVSGEEIGLFGSKYYTENPLFPLTQTVVDLNMDMIGRVKQPADSTKETPMTGPDGVFVISDSQSKDLMAIAADADAKSKLNFDYSLSGRDHPLQLFARSDHYNFVTKDIPVLFFSSGIHTDYHTPGDVIEKLDFAKMELVTRTMYEIGLTVANRKTRLVVDNPFSTWTKSAR